MPHIIIEGVPGLDGKYELDLTFTHRDFRTIKQLAGVRANEVMAALEAGDLDIIVALAEIALQRAGKVHAADQLWDSTAGGITLDVTDMEEQEDDASPPSLTPPALVDESRPSGDRPSSGLSTNGDMDASPERLTLATSGIPPPDAS